MELLFSMIALCIAGIAVVGVMASSVAVSECREREAFRYAVAGIACFFLALLNCGLGLYWLARAIVVAVR